MQNNLTWGAMRELKYWFFPKPVYCKNTKLVFTKTSELVGWLYTLPERSVISRNVAPSKLWHCRGCMIPMLEPLRAICTAFQCGSTRWTYVLWWRLSFVYSKNMNSLLTCNSSVLVVWAASIHSILTSLFIPWKHFWPYIVKAMSNGRFVSGWMSVSKTLNSVQLFGADGPLLSNSWHSVSFWRIKAVFVLLTTQENSIQSPYTLLPSVTVNFTSPKANNVWLF